jgi:uncharacterized membrane protein (UPF0136 family)
MDETHSKGLAGAVSGLSRRAYGLVNNPERWALQLVLFAGVITIFKKNASPDLWSYAMWFGVALGIAALLYEMTASRGIIRAYWEGRAGSLLWCSVIWAVAFGFSINNWIGAASENQAEKTAVHKTAFIKSDSAIKAVKDAEEALSRLKSKFDWSKSLDAPESYDARIEAAEADAAFEATRKGCKSKCIAKQQLAASLKAERANAIDRAATAEEIKVAERQLAEARAKANATKIEVSENRNDLVILTKYAGMTEESAQIFNGLFSIIVVSILLSFGSMHAELEELRKHGPRKPFGILTNIWRKFYRVWKGTEPPGVKIIENTTIEYKTDRPLAAGFAAVGRHYGVV